MRWCVMSMGGAGVGVGWGRRRRAEQMTMLELDGGMERVVVADGADVVLVVCGMYVWHGCDGQGAWWVWLVGVGCDGVVVG